MVLGIGAIVGTIFLVRMAQGNAQQQETQLKAEVQKAKQEAARVQAELQKKQQQASANSDMEVQAMTAIPAGSPITESMVTAVESTDGPPVPHSYSQVQAVIGKISITPIAAGSILTQDKLMDASAVLDVPPGYRAITIPVNPIGAVNGASLPGSRVDVVMSLQDQAIVRTLLQNVLVIAIGTESNKTVHSATLSVTPNDAELLALAGMKGTFTLTLRGLNDKAISQSDSGVDIASLLNHGHSEGLAPKLFHNLRPPVQFTPNAAYPGEIPVSDTGINGNDSGLPPP